MSSNFELVVEQIIEKYDLEKLSESVGWPKVKQIRRDLENKKTTEMTPEKAVDEFLELRPSYRSLKGNAGFKKEMAKMIR